MKENTYISTGGVKASECLNALIKNIIKVAFEGRVIKAALMVLLIAGGVAKAGAEEVTGTILFEPEKFISLADNLYYTYKIDSTGNSFSNRDLIASKRMYERDIVFDTLTKYFVPGQKFVFENKGRNEFHEIYLDEVIALIAPDGQVIELTQMFSRSDIRRYLTELDKKLRREGR
jgi:hypothetical protein